MCLLCACSGKPKDIDISGKWTAGYYTSGGISYYAPEDIKETHTDVTFIFDENGKCVGAIHDEEYNGTWEEVLTTEEKTRKFEVVLDDEKGYLYMAESDPNVLYIKDVGNAVPDGTIVYLVKDDKTLEKAKEVSYQEALEDIKQGGYEHAISVLTGLGSYKDSKELKYNAYVDSGDYESAVIFADEFEDGEEKKEAVAYLAEYKLAESTLADGDRITAYTYFRGLSGYEDSDERADAIAEEIYREATGLMANGDTIKAAAMLKDISDYKDSKALMESVWDNPDMTMTFGRYEQDNNKANGPEEMEWYVINKQGDRLLLLSKNIIDSCRYTYQDSYLSGNALQGWLDVTFYENSFNDDEKKMLVEYGLQPTLPTYAFALSEDEIESYVTSVEIRRSKVTDYAKMQGVSADVDGYGSWWVRSELSGGKAVIVDEAGTVINEGVPGDAWNRGVRPAVLIDISK